MCCICKQLKRLIRFSIAAPHPPSIDLVTEKLEKEVYDTRDFQRASDRGSGSRCCADPLSRLSPKSTVPFVPSTLVMGSLAVVSSNRPAIS
jgi:hypothetical protein